MAVAAAPYPAVVDFDQDRRNLDLLSVIMSDLYVGIMVVGRCRP